VLKIGARKIAFTTDSYVVDPIFFPGGDIGSLAVYGTVNDLAVCGAKPLFISVGVVMEEGLEMSVLEKITASVGSAAKRAGVRIVTGDTKVVEKGSCDKIFICASGIGKVYYDGLSTKRIRPGDSVIVSGPVGDHAVSVLSKREGLDFGTKVKSDSAPLNTLVAAALKASKKVRFMRDPTRGGVATTLNEIAEGSSFGIAIDENRVPVREGVRQACELLGLDPLYLACEGRVIIVVAEEDEAKVLRALRSESDGRSARTIGRVTRENAGRVYLNTAAGGKRLVDMLAGEQLPRIC
jgi:hydrogenase expression/formation protein HypE